MLADLLVLTQDPATGAPPTFALSLPTDEEDERWITSGRVSCDVHAGVLHGCEITLTDAFVAEIAEWFGDEQLIADELSETVTVVVATAAALLDVRVAQSFSVDVAGTVPTAPRRHAA